MISNLKFQNNLLQSVQYKNTIPIIFRANPSDEKPDTFEQEKKEKSKDKSKYFWMTTTFATLIALLTTKFKLTKSVEKAAKDGMTGLYNKTRLLSDLNQTFSKSINKGQEYSVAMLDMDNFKAINEVFDHKTGDTFLKRIADNINSLAQKYNAKGYRYGGEEFVVIMPNTNKETAKKIISEIAESIKKDDVIQNYIPQFIEKTDMDIKFLKETLSKLDSTIFRSIRRRQNDKIKNYDLLANDIVEIINKHIKKYNPSDVNVLKEIVKTIKTASKKELPTVLSVNTKFGNSDDLGHALDKIHSQYLSQLHDLEKWSNHLKANPDGPQFTISGGVATFRNEHSIENPASTIKIADAALKSAKENGKNLIVRADESLIKRVLEEK